MSASEHFDQQMRPPLLPRPAHLCRLAHNLVGELLGQRPFPSLLRVLIRNLHGIRRLGPSDLRRLERLGGTLFLLGLRRTQLLRLFLRLEIGHLRPEGCSSMLRKPHQRVDHAGDRPDPNEARRVGGEHLGRVERPSHAKHVIRPVARNPRDPADQLRARPALGAVVDEQPATARANGEHMALGSELQGRRLLRRIASLGKKALDQLGPRPVRPLLVKEDLSNRLGTFRKIGRVRHGNDHHATLTVVRVHVVRGGGGVGIVDSLARPAATPLGRQGRMVLMNLGRELRSRTRHVVVHAWELRRWLGVEQAARRYAPYRA